MGKIILNSVENALKKVLTNDDFIRSDEVLVVGSSLRT